MKIIDAHNHPDWHGHNLDRFLANMEKNGIEKTWLLSWELPKNEYLDHYDAITPGALLGVNDGIGPVPFSRCINYKERAPEKFILGYAPHPSDPDALDKLNAAVTLYDVKICGEFKFRVCYDNPDAIRLFRRAGELGLPVTIHLQYDLDKRDNCMWKREEWFGGSMDAFERAVAACPDTNFLGHAPGFWIHISNDDLYKTTNYPPENTKTVPGGQLPEMLKKYPNLYCDISAGSGCRALSRDSEFAREFIIEFQDRILFARDYFDDQHYKFLMSIDLPEAVQHKVFHGNAEKLVDCN